MSQNTIEITWYKVGEVEDLPVGRVKTVSVSRGDSVLQLCLTHVGDKFSALDNHCPHQGGPLGEGSIECDDDGKCYLRCPWHGWDFDPVTGKPPGGYDDGVPVYPVQVRDGEIYVGLESIEEHQRTVTDVMAETMVGWGMTHVFGMVGHSNLGLADAIRRRCEAEELEFIGIRHEGAAAFAASAFGKLTGRPAACLTIAGPGATNLYTGCWDAKVDRSPMLALTGQVTQQVFGPGAFQELPLKDAFSSVTSFSHLCLPKSNHAELMSLAIKSALIDRQVAHLIFPDDTQTQPADQSAKAGTSEGRLGDVRIRPPADKLAEAVDLLRGAKRPVIVVGHGARFEMGTVTALAEELGCPVLTTFKGKGILADCADPQMPSRTGHPLGCGVLGRSGTPIASWFMNECDLLLVFGASFSNHTGITSKKPTIQVDNDRGQLARFHAIDCPLWGEIGETAGEMLTALRGNHASIDHRLEIAERWRIWREEKASRLGDTSDDGVSSIAVFDAMNRLVPANAIIAVDVGNNTYSFGRYFEASGHQAVLMSGYLGSIGFGYPAAMGAWAASRAHKYNGDEFWRQFADRPIICVSGDGGFGQYPWEVNTAVRHGMNLTHVLLNNNELGKISKEQKAGHWSVWQTGLTNPNIADYVTSCGGLGIRVERSGDLLAAIEKALAYDGPATVEVMTAADLI